MDKKYSRFDFRFENHFLEDLQVAANYFRCSLNKIVQDALKSALIHYRNGYFHVRQRSDFLERVDKCDIKIFQVIFEAEEREMLRKLAYTFRLSQAEVLRLALECYIYVSEGVVKGMVKKYEEKCRYTTASRPKMIIIYDLHASGEQFYHMFGIPPDYELSIMGSS